jgi:SWIM zinc finger
VWGLCAGSGKRPYQTVVDLTGPAYKCSCPSRKFPCKHALALLLNWADDGAPVFDSENAAALAALGVPTFACTPDAFPDLLAVAIDGGDIAAWAHRSDLAAR